MATRTALVTTAFAAPVFRALLEAAEAVVELHHLLKPGRAVIDVGDWELGAFVGWPLGLGVVVEHSPAGTCVTDPERLEVIVYVGPLALTATRERLPEVAPLAGRAV